MLVGCGLRSASVGPIFAEKLKHSRLGRFWHYLLPMAARVGNWLPKKVTWNLFFHGQDREQNFTKFFTKLCAPGTPKTPVIDYVQSKLHHAAASLSLSRGHLSRGRRLASLRSPLTTQSGPHRACSAPPCVPCSALCPRSRSQPDSERYCNKWISGAATP